MNVASPSALADKPLFETIGRLLARFPSAELPDTVALTRLLREVAPQAATLSGHAVNFVPPTPDGVAYERRITATGQVETRANDWHDFFNALAWCVWPASKMICNALHAREIAVRPAGDQKERGPCRDALTQLDECGMIVASADAAVLELLVAQEWEEVFWRRRNRLVESTRYAIFGHALWCQLRQPFHGLCAKVLYRAVDTRWLSWSVAQQQTDNDRWLAEYLGQGAATLTPRLWRPLPLLGIPGLTPDNAAAQYYRDQTQFRPRRSRHG